MRITLRVWLALIAAVALVLFGGVVLRVREEQRLLMDVTLKDRQFFATALATVLQSSDVEADPLRVARSFVDHDEIAGAHIEARIVSLQGGEVPLPKIGAELVNGLTRGEVLVVVHGDEILSYVPVDPAGRSIIELSEPQAASDLLARVGWWSLAFQTLTLAMLLAGVTYWLLRWFVGSPLQKLANLARRIGNGELDARVTVEPDADDEVAILGHEMNRMGERLLEAKQTVEDLEAKRTETLEQLRHADRLRTAGQLAGVLAHELGTPLNVVFGHARILEQELATSDEGRSSAKTILEQVTRMTRIIKDLLGFVRRGQRAGRCDLVELAETAKRTLQPLLGRQRVKVEVSSTQPVLLEADAQQLLQVLTNLIVNAMQATHTPDGVVQVLVDTVEADPPVGVHAKPGRYGRLAVVDRGIGIPKEAIPRLFEPFFSTRNEGTGLGLAVVDGIVREHHGWIRVESAVGEGSRFEVFLPSDAQAAGASDLRRAAKA
jgi:two-component system, NtrC family, sensor kinase